MNGKWTKSSKAKVRPMIAHFPKRPGGTMAPVTAALACLTAASGSLNQLDSETGVRGGQTHAARTGKPDAYRGYRML